MARSKSVILTPAEKKEVLVNLKTQIKSQEDLLKKIRAAGKFNDGTLANAVKEAAKTDAIARKAHAAQAKGLAKDEATIFKALTASKAQLSSLQAPKKVAETVEA